MHLENSCSTTAARCWVTGFVLVSLSGCTGTDLGKVSGKVTLDGEPVQGAILEFIPQTQGGTTSFGLTKADGAYEMEFSSSSGGVLLGQSLVRITSNDDVIISGKNYHGIEVFPKKYNRHSEQEVTVNPGHNEFDFHCESDENTRRAMAKKKPGYNRSLEL